MYIAICDDQPEELRTLTVLLQSWQKDHPGVRCRYFRNADALLEAARHERFTLYLLDVMMPGVDGMNAAREIRMFDTAADIVFLTSSPGFAYESYGVKALEYLLKPVRGALLYPVLDRLYLRESQPDKALVVKADSAIIRVPFSQLAFVEVREVSGAMKDYEQALLTRPEFVRIHRSYIVNMLQIEELSPAGVHTFSGAQLPVSRLLYSRVQEAYTAFLFSDR